jgi:glycosyltransferase involved in cell wall biosynthesis
MLSLRGKLSRAIRRPRRPRLALVTPWPPETSGVASYNRQLVAALAQRVDVDVVTAGPVSDYAAPPEPGVRLVSATARDVFADAGRYDRVLFCMGNSRFHAHVFDLFTRHPDAVLFHDVELTGFFGSIAGQERPEDPARALTERIAAMYRDDADGGHGRDGRRLYMTRAIQAEASDCFVHCDAALAMLASDRAEHGSYAPAGTLLYGLPAVADDAVPRTPVSATPCVITLGVVADVKGIASLIQAFALVAQAHPGARLVIAGAPAEDDDPNRWRDYARLQAPAANIELPGRLSDAEFAALLREADVAVQMRLASNGEASGATAECLAAGMPTIVTDLGWAGELPIDVASRLPVDATPALIAERIDELLGDTAKRTLLSGAALEHARTHGFARAADAYVNALGLV